MDFDKLDKINQVASDIRTTYNEITWMSDFLRNMEGLSNSAEFRVPVTGTSEPGIVVITAPVLRHAVEQVLKEAEAKRDRLIAKFESM